MGSSLSLVGGPNGMTSYSWTGPNGFTSSDQSPLVSNNASLGMAGDYILTINGTSSATTTVIINPLPTSTISGILTACVTTTLTAGTDAITPAYIWYKDDIVISGQTTSSLVVTASGDYKVKVTNENGCEQNSTASTVTINQLPTTSAIYHQ